MIIPGACNLLSSLSPNIIITGLGNGLGANTRHVSVSDDHGDIFTDYPTAFGTETGVIGLTWAGSFWAASRGDPSTLKSVSSDSGKTWTDATTTNAHDLLAFKPTTGLIAGVQRGTSTPGTSLDGLVWTDATSTHAFDNALAHSLVYAPSLDIFLTTKGTNCNWGFGNTTSAFLSSDGLAYSDHDFGEAASISD